MAQRFYKNNSYRPPWSSKSSNASFNDMSMNSYRSSSYNFGQPIISQSFAYNVIMMDFHLRTEIKVSSLKKDLAAFKLPTKLAENAQKLNITKLSTCQSLFMSQLYEDEDRQKDFIVHTPHLSGLTTGVAISMIHYVMDYKEYDRTNPMQLSPIVVVLCEDDNAVNRISNIFCGLADDTGVMVKTLHQQTWRANLEKCFNCDILVVSPHTMGEIAKDGLINRTRLYFIFVDWADKVYKSFQLPSTRNLIKYLGETKKAVRILGCEHIYESRREYYGDSCRGNLIELHIQSPAE